MVVETQIQHASETAVLKLKNVAIVFAPLLLNLQLAGAVFFRRHG
jgi:hypothetical protein